MLTALLIMLGLALALGMILGISALVFKVEGDPLVARIDAILPQTQCGQCGFPGCKPYAPVSYTHLTLPTICSV